MKSLIQKTRVALVTVAGTVLYGASNVMAQQTGFLSPTDSPTAVSAGTGGEGSIRTLTLTVVNFLLGFLGIVAVLMIIYGGVMMVVSQGNPEKVGQGKKIIIYTTIGLLIVLLSYAIVNTVLGAASGQQA